MFELFSSLQAFKNANITSAFAIQKVQTEELFNSNTSDPEVRQRKKTDKSSLIKLSSGIQTCNTMFYKYILFVI